MSDKPHKNVFPSKVVVATSNAHKVDELQHLAKMHGVDTTLYSWSELASPIDIEETGATFEENAYIKAITVHQLTGMPVIADDSGLEVHALGGEPGVRSARYAGEDATDADNRTKLAMELHKKVGHAGTQASDNDGHAEVTPQADVSGHPRAATFRCVLCYTDGHRTVFGEGLIKGLIVTHERGTNGFGYDPLFMPEAETRTFAEMLPHEKHAFSHRSRAFRDLVKNLQSASTSTLPQRHFLVQAAIAAALNNEDQLRSATQQAVTSVDDAQRVYEAVLQTYLFAGYPAALDGLVVVADECKTLLGSPLHHDIEPFDLNVFRERGTELCRTIYGNVYDKLMVRLDEVSPDLREWMIVEGYGKTLARAGLDVITRELCVVGVLAAMGRTTQLYSHVRGAMLAGATQEDMALCIDVVTETDTARHADVIRTIMQSISTS